MGGGGWVGHMASHMVHTHYRPDTTEWLHGYIHKQYISLQTQTSNNTKAIFAQHTHTHKQNVNDKSVTYSSSPSNTGATSTAVIGCPLSRDLPATLHPLPQSLDPPMAPSLLHTTAYKKGHRVTSLVYL